MLDNSYVNKFSGTLFWSYAANDGYGNWDNCKNELFSFHSFHYDSVFFTGCDTTASINYINKINDGLKIYYGNDRIIMQYKNTHLPAYWEIYNFVGQQVIKGEIKNNSGTEEINVSNLSQGLYFITINREHIIENNNLNLSLIVHCSLFIIN